MKENLHHWIYHPESHWTNEFKAHIETKEQEWIDFILKVDGITLSHQRNHAAKELQYYIDDYSILNFFYCFTFCYEITIFICYIYDCSDGFNDYSLLAIYFVIRKIWR